MGMDQKKVIHLMPDWVNQFPSNFELLHLAYEAILNKEILWVISTFCCNVWNERVSNGSGKVGEYSEFESIQNSRKVAACQSCDKLERIQSMRAFRTPGQWLYASPVISWREFRL